jgi:Tetratricopeptide repeat
MKQRSHAAIGSATTSVDHVRLFRNRPEHRWCFRVHEQIKPDLHEAGAGVRWTDIAIEHTGYTDPAVARAKIERNVRLLRLDQSEHPDDPFILFNLGWATLELGDPAAAVPLLRHSLEQSATGDSIVPMLYAFLTEAHLRLGQHDAARSACRAGRARYPDDPDLLLREVTLRRRQGDLRGAEELLRPVLPGPPHPNPSPPTGGRGASATPAPIPGRYVLRNERMLPSSDRPHVSQPLTSTTCCPTSGRDPS